MYSSYFSLEPEGQAPKAFGDLQVSNEQFTLGEGENAPLEVFNFHTFSHVFVWCFDFGKGPLVIFVLL